MKLINAATDKPFKEYLTSDSTPYVEMEPDDQYWIQVQSHFPENRVCKCKLEVDGKDLQTSLVIYGGEVEDKNGVCGSDKGIMTERAMQVKKLSGSSGSAFWIGTVKVRFFNAINKRKGRLSRKDAEAGWENENFPKWENENIPTYRGNNEKTIASSPGTVAETSLISPGVCVTYKYGKLLQTIELRYCTTVGLILAGLLPKPPIWNFHRLLFPAAVDSTVAIVEPTLVPIKIKTSDGSTDTEETYNEEHFDLTHLDDNVEGTATANNVTDDSSSSQNTPDSPQKPTASQKSTAPDDGKNRGDNDHSNNSSENGNLDDSGHSPELEAEPVDGSSKRGPDEVRDLYYQQRRLSRRQKRDTQYRDWDSEEEDNNSDDFGVAYEQHG